ncbi:N-acetyltransferase [Phenylobacterium sp.]|uniref:GNAT family N-acetyltransferase n=1 Tax=Phenylobacterium sp. TaxID=1871053 RepID=UPI00271FB494|nr:GNAT family N-acetyltransferase [Phenylobacterium sp.]MDO8800508.1 GNAT family N-acetyltransferase [Phenylobacterium sp.]
MITPDLPVIEGALSAFIDGSAVAELQELLERCTDFEVLVTGHPPEPYAARELLVDVPPDHPLRDKFVIGLWTDQGLTAAIDLLRDFPEPHVWYLGLLLLAPEARGSGLGARIVEALKTWIRSHDGRAIRLVTQDQNPDALRFWLAQGFVQIGTATQDLMDRTNQVARLELKL